MNEDHSRARALLALNEKPRDIAETVGISYQKVLSLKKEMEKDAKDRQLGILTTLDPIAMDVIVEKAKIEAPKRVVKEIERIQEGLSGLAKLDAEFHTTFSNVLAKAEDFLAREDLKASEWVSITNALGNAYNNIFNNSGVNVHVDNSTKVSNNSLSMFKDSVRG